MGRRRALILQKRQVLVFFVFLGLSQASAESLRYSVAEETEIGSFVANLAKDLGLGVAELSSREARVVSDDNKKHLLLNLLTGDMLLNERLDRKSYVAPPSPVCCPFRWYWKTPYSSIELSCTSEI